jgi:TIR domain
MPACDRFTGSSTAGRSFPTPPRTEAKCCDECRPLRSLGCRCSKIFSIWIPAKGWAREIDHCDVFLLFWSFVAANSEWVAKEIDYALARKAGDGDGLPEIQPVSIEGPPIPPPPKSLNHLHFNDALLTHIATSTASQAAVSIAGFDL